MPELFQGDVCTRFRCHFISGVNARDAIPALFWSECGTSTVSFCDVEEDGVLSMEWDFGYMTMKSGCLVLNNQARGPRPLVPPPRRHLLVRL